VEATTELKTIECPNCGAPIRAGELTCDHCGSAIRAARATEVAVPAVADAHATIAAMQARIKANPYDGEAYYQLGLALFTLQLYDQAEHAFEQARQFLPGSAEVHYFTGLAMLRGAEKEILSVEHFRLTEMQRGFETAAKLDPNLREAQPHLDFIRGLLARNAEDYAGALAPLKEAVETLPNFGLAWKALAACAFQTGDFHEAIRAGKQALQARPDDADAAYLIGAAYFRLKQLDEMEAWARRAAEMRDEPDSWGQIVKEYRGEFE
jgi:tetratricopeptide (TPR) repeat protein